MKEILIFAGTTEGRKLSECLAESGICNTLSVATEYGEFVLKEHPLVKVCQGRMDREEIREFIEKGDFGAVVDATHPYADAVTENIRFAMEKTKIPYIQLKRELSVCERREEQKNGKPDENEETQGKREREREKETRGEIFYFNSHETCAAALEKEKGAVLLTTGSRELGKYCAHEGLKDRLYVRVLPGKESISLCEEWGIRGKQLIAMQGPFTVMMNEALIDQYGISCLVTKVSGKPGGYPEKLAAAKRAGIPVFVVGHPGDEEGDSFEEVCCKLEKLCGRKIQRDSGEAAAGLEIILAGAGMGDKSGLTGEAARAIERADILLGSERLLEAYASRAEKRAYYRAEQIVSYLKEVQEKGGCAKKAVILFSGDTGFHSGCFSVYHALDREIKRGSLRAFLKVLPGISSVAYLAAAIGESYGDAAVYSMHGKKLHRLVPRIREREKTYLLTSGLADVHGLGKALAEAGMGDCRIAAGYRLSYEEQQIKWLTPEECCTLKEEGLYTCFIRNPYPVAGRLTHGMGDGEFIRDQAPMTKEEVREVSICKLRLCRNAVVYDIGSGTGSMAVEMAGLSPDIRVYAIERKKEAAALIMENKEKFRLDNIIVVEAEAPEGLRKLPEAAYAFIGGSGGNLKEILCTLYGINPHMRVVMNAVSMETLCEIKEILSLYPVENEEIVQIQVSRVRQTGGYHMMQGENPVWICAFDFAGNKGGKHEA